MMSALWVCTHNDTVVATCDITALACDTKTICVQKFEWGVTSKRIMISRVNTLSTELALLFWLCQGVYCYVNPVNPRKLLWIYRLVACRLFIGQPLCKFIGQFGGYMTQILGYLTGTAVTMILLRSSFLQQWSWPENIIIALVYVLLIPLYSPLHKCCVVNLIVVSLLVCTKMTVIMEYTSAVVGCCYTVRFTDTALVKFVNLRGSVNNVELIRSCNTTLTPY